MNLLKTLAIFVASCLLHTGAHASERMAGLMNSPRGFGFAYVSPVSPEVFNRFSVYADIYGMPLGRAINPGLKFAFSNNHILATSQTEALSITYFAGAGLSCGLVHDFEPVSSLPYLEKPYGVSATLGANVGFFMDFGKPISFCFSLSPELGFHITKDKQNGPAVMSIYKNGLLQTLYPQFDIFWKF